MPTFQYRAKSEDLMVARGDLEAPDLDQAVLVLKGRGLYPVEIVPQQDGPHPARKPLTLRLSKSELALFTRCVSQALSAGVPLPGVLHLIAEQEQGRRVGEVASQLERRLLQGDRMSGAMRRLPEAFPPTSVALVEAGESGGALEEVLHRISLWTEREVEIAQRVRAALAYPLFVLAVGFLTLLALLLFAVPKLAEVFSELEQPLPWITRWMVFCSRWIAGAGPWMALTLALLWLPGRRSLGRSLARKGFSVLGRMPIVRPLLIRTDLARWAHTAGLLLEQGIPLTEALRLSQQTAAQAHHRTALAGCLHDVVEGIPLSHSLRSRRMGDPFLHTLAATGEAEGNLGRNLLHAAQAYEDQMDRTIRLLGALIEPALVVAVGLAAGVVVFSMLLPILQMSAWVK